MGVRIFNGDASVRVCSVAHTRRGLVAISDTVIYKAVVCDDDGDDDDDDAFADPVHFSGIFTMS